MNEGYTPITMVGLLGSVRIDTELGSGMTLMPPSLTLILHMKIDEILTRE